MWRGCERKKNLLAKTYWSAEAVILGKFKRNREEKRKDRRKKSCIHEFHRGSTYRQDAHKILTS